jgi:hypothetical protein
LLTTSKGRTVIHGKRSSPLNEEQSFLHHTSLGLAQWRALRAFKNATDDFEPLCKRIRIDGVTLDELLAFGLAEAGPTSHRFDSSDGPTGYRLSPLGRQVLDRGPWATPQPPCK